MDTHPINCTTATDEYSFAWCYSFNGYCKSAVPNNQLQIHFYMYLVATVLLMCAGSLFLVHPNLNMPVNRLTAIVLLAEAYLYSTDAQFDLMCKGYWPQLKFWQK